MKFFLLALLITTNAFAQMDYRLSTRGRSYPLSGIFEADLGYNYLLWKKNAPVLYGYIRPNVTYGDIGLYRLATAALDFHPISFIKIRGGFSREMSHVLRRDLDCSQIECQGVIKHRFLETNLLLGAASYFTSLRYRINTSRRDDGGARFLDFEAMMPMQGQQDQSQYFQGVVGKSIDSNWSALWASQVASSQKAQGFSTAHYALGMWSKGPWEIAAGPGAFHSTLFDWGFSSVFWVTWNGGNSLALKKNK